MITDVAGILVGHHTDLEALTGCTVVICPEDTIVAGEVNGGGPATRETDIIRPGMSVEVAHAVLLSGGSAFGLAAADGVMRFLEEQGRGVQTPVSRVPIVPTACLFDLGVGDPTVRPTAADGYAACSAAAATTEEGNVGAGTGATVGKMEGLGRVSKGGLGSASRAQGGVTVGALMAVNAVGEVHDGEGNVIAGIRDASDENPALAGWLLPGTNTTIGVVATDAPLSREQAHRLAVAAHRGMDRVTEPAHTEWDGDTIFVLATGTADEAPPWEALEEMAIEAVAEAIVRGVRAAEAVPGAPTGAGR